MLVSRYKSKTVRSGDCLETRQCLKGSPSLFSYADKDRNGRWWLILCACVVQPNRGRPAADSEHLHSSNMLSSDTFSGHAPDGSYAISVQPTDQQLMYSQEDSKLWHWQHYHLQQQQQQNVAQLSDDHAVLVPTRTEQLPRDVQQSMITAGAVVQQHVPVNGIAASSSDAMLPAPVRDIYQRLVDKQQQVTCMSADSDDVSRLLTSVHRGTWIYWTVYVVLESVQC